MNLRNRDAGKVFVAPSGRHVEFVAERGGAFLFQYRDDPSDGLALSQDALRILEKPSREPSNPEGSDRS